jgi:4,5-dihydroxyphthalate decarboxylase
VMKTALLDEVPGIAQRLTDAFTAAKGAYMKRLDADDTPEGKAARALSAVVGDPFPFGLAPNRKALDALVRFSVEQRVMAKAIAVEDLFVR